jgi:hypothetical protein
MDLEETGCGMNSFHLRQNPVADPENIVMNLQVP